LEPCTGTCLEAPAPVFCFFPVFLELMVQSSRNAHTLRSAQSFMLIHNAFHIKLRSSWSAILVGPMNTQREVQRERGLY
jgi:hypothetical protein